MTLTVDIRLAQAADIPAIAQIHLDSSKIAYRDILDQALLDALSLTGRIALWESRYASMGPFGQLWVQSIGSEIIGFALCDAPEACELAPATCELKSFYLTPNFWGCGLGARLLGHAERDYRMRGCRVMILWTIRQNARARAFYERVGFCCQDVTRRTRREEPGQILEYEEVRYARMM